MQAVKSTKVLFVSRVSQARVYSFYWSNLLRRSLSGMKQLLQCDGPKKKKKKCRAAYSPCNTASHKPHGLE